MYKEMFLKIFFNRNLIAAQHHHCDVIFVLIYVQTITKVIY